MKKAICLVLLLSLTWITFPIQAIKAPPIFKSIGKHASKRIEINEHIQKLSDYKSCSSCSQAAARALAKLDWQPSQDEKGAYFYIAQEEWEKCVAIGEPAVKPLIAVLKDSESDVRRAAAETLGKIGDKRAVEALIAVLKDSHWLVLIAAAEALGKIGDKRTVEPLIAVLKDSHWLVLIAAAEALGKIGDKRTVEPLIAVLKDSHWLVLIAAAEALGKIGDKRTVEPLIAVLKDSHWLVLIAAAEALGKIGDKRAVEPLIAVLKDSHWLVRKTAAQALIALGWQPSQDETGAYFYIAQKEWEKCVAIGTLAIKPLIFTLKTHDADIRQFAAQTLIKLGWQPSQDETGAYFYIAQQEWDKCIAIGAPAVKPLIASLLFRESDLYLFGAKTNTDVRQTAADTLVKIGTPAVEPLIVELSDGIIGCRHHTDTCTTIIKILGQIGDARAVKPLIFALRTYKKNIRQAAINALIKIGIPSVKPLIAILKDNNAKIRQAAAQALVKLSWQPSQDEAGAYFYIVQRKWEQCVAIGVPAIKPLIATLQDTKDTDVRQAATNALVKIGTPTVEPLIAALKNNNANLRIRKSIANTLVKVGNMAVVPLIALLKDNNSNIRQSASQALGKIGDQRAVKPLIALLQDNNSNIRQSAAQALGQIGNKRAVKPLIVLLQDNNPSVRQSASQALVKIGWQPSQDEIGAYFHIAQQNWEKCVAIGTPAIKPLLSELRNNNMNAADALGKIGNAQAIEFLIVMLNDNKASRAAAATLTKFSPWHLITHISNFAKHLSWSPYFLNKQLQHIYGYQLVKFMPQWWLWIITSIAFFGIGVITTINVLHIQPTFSSFEVALAAGAITYSALSLIVNSQAIIAWGWIVVAILFLILLVTHMKKSEVIPWVIIFALQLLMFGGFISSLTVLEYDIFTWIATLIGILSIIAAFVIIPIGAIRKDKPILYTPIFVVTSSLAIAIAFEENISFNLFFAVLLENIIGVIISIIFLSLFIGTFVIFTKYFIPQFQVPKWVE